MGRDKILQSALAKSVELRALHAALQNGNSSHVSRSHSLVSAQDYPVFTPTYDEEPLPAYHQAIALQSRPLSGNYATDPANHSGQIVLRDSENQDIYKHQTVPHSHVSQAEEIHKSNADSFANRRSITAIRSPNVEYIAKSSRSSLTDVKSITSCYKFKPSVTTRTDMHNTTKLDNKCYRDDAAVPLTDSNLSYQSQPRNRGMSLSWLFPRFKKNNKQQNKYTSENSNFNSPHRVVESEPASCTGSELGMISAERLKKKLIEARESRNVALMTVSEMRTSMHELAQNLEQVESYCQELKRTLQQTGQVQGLRVNNQLQNFQKHERISVLGNNCDKGMPVSKDVLIEGFLQVVSEARLSVKQFCKDLLIQIEHSEDDALVDSLNMLLQPYHQSLASKHSKLLLYHLEAIINQALFQDFENCTFQRNGSPELLDPHQLRQAQFASYMALQDLSWNDVLSKGTKHYSPEFSKFCDQKMSCIISLLNWTRPWPEHLLQAFFVSSKGIWLLHLLAFSFNPPLGILRVEEQRSFDPHYMDDMLADRYKSRGPSRVKAMVMPGFYVRDRVVRCKVICKYKPPLITNL